MLGAVPCNTNHYLSDYSRVFSLRMSVALLEGLKARARAEGRRVSGQIVDLEAATVRNACVRVLPMDLAQAREFALLAALDDPFDRMIVAAARATGRALITGDARIGDSGLVPVVWD